MSTEHDLITRAVEMARQDVDDGGKPFACLIVEDGEVVEQAVDHVAQTGGPTAHAEILAIRAAAEGGLSDLTGHDVIVTACPCPMCLGALHSAQPDRVLFAATREQEGEHHEDGDRLMSLSTFSDQYAKPIPERALPPRQAEVDDPTAPFRAWTSEHQDD